MTAPSVKEEYAISYLDCMGKKI